jgi:hypothetical protein
VHQSDAGLTLAQYAQAKQLNLEHLRAWGLSDAPYCGLPAVKIPYRDEAGEEVAARFRLRLGKSAEGDERFKWKSGAKVCLYGQEHLPLARERGYVVVVEGESDCHTLWDHNEPTIGIPGANNWNEDRDAPLLTDIPLIYVVIESDNGGETVLNWLRCSAIRERVHLINLGSLKDPSGLYLADPDDFPERWLAAKEAALPLSEEPVADVADVTHTHGEEGSALLDAVEAFLQRFVAYPSEHARVAHTLWVGHCHAMDAWDSTPRLAFLSPEPASGKTRGLEVTELLVPNPVEAVNVTAPYLFRKVDDPDGVPTVLFDEVDTIFGPKARDHEDVRGLLNAGHRKGAVAGRCIVRGKAVETVEYSAYCAVALAGLGDLPDTILTRSVIIRMRRRAKSERVEPFRRRIAITEGHALRGRLAAWAGRAMGQLQDAWPEMPPGIEDRDADVWEALLAVADAAGGDWPERARAAAVTLVAQSKESTPSLGIRLLADLHTVFGNREAMSTEDALSDLCELPEAPWGEVAAGKPLNARGLAKRLTGYGVKSKSVRVGEKVVRGYARKDLVDAWDRYLPPPDVADSSTAALNASSTSPRESATSATPQTPLPLNGSKKPRINANISPGNGWIHQAPVAAMKPVQSATTLVESGVGKTNVADVADSRGDREKHPRSAFASSNDDEWAGGEEEIL